MDSKIKIIVAKNIGFCFGVRRAISIAEKTLKEKESPVQFLGSLVHNENVIKNLSNKGIIFKKNIKEIKSGVLIIQAHGFPPFSKNFSKKIIIRDATCPLVKKVQILAKSLQEKGYQIIIIGDKSHSEIKGIKGYAKNKGIVIKDKKEAKQIIGLKNKKIAVISQTTQNSNNVNQILKTLREKYKEIKYFNTICPEVQIRQKEARLIAEKSDGILVVGSKSSANTKRLYEISKKSKKPVWWINSLKELKKIDINNLFTRPGKSTLGLISGTSAENSEIKKIKNYLFKLGEEDKSYS